MTAVSATAPSVAERESSRPHTPVLGTAVALMSATAFSALFGFLFWVVAARWFPADQVGRASAAVSSMSLLAGLAQLNLISLYARFLPTAGHRSRRLILAGYAASAVASLLLATGFLTLGGAAGLIGDRPVSRLIFTVAVVASAIFFIQDGVLAALHRPAWVPVKNVFAAAGKLALLPVLAEVTLGDGLLLAWMAPMLLSMLAVNWWILTRLAPTRAGTGTPAAPTPARRELLSFASAEYLNGLLTNAVAFLPPVLVNAVLGPAASAYFYLPWLVGVAGSTLVWNVVTSFVVSASSDGQRGRIHASRAVLLTGAIVGTGAVVPAVAAGPVLGLLGPEYVAQGATALRLIGFSLPFSGVILLYSAFAIMEKRMWRLAAIQSAVTAVFFVGSWWGLHHAGGVAPAAALLATHAVAASVLAPGLLRRYRATGDRSRPPAWAASPPVAGAPTTGAL